MARYFLALLRSMPDFSAAFDSDDFCCSHFRSSFTCASVTRRIVPIRQLLSPEKLPSLYP